MTEPNRSELQHPREAILDQSEARPWPADRVERWPLDRLVPYARNARTHSPAQVSQIAASMREWGWTNPILVDEKGTIIAGHGRVAAARQLAWTEAPVMVARGWSEAQKKAYVIADNKLALNAGWDDELLRLELQDLEGMGADLSLLGFCENEFALSGDVGQGLTDEDEAPALSATPITRAGDTWVLGAHRVRCGDSTSAEDVALLLGSNQPLLMVTEPTAFSLDSPGGGRDMASKRELIDTGTDKRYVRRDEGGHFKESDDQGRSLASDRRTKAKRAVKSGQGDKGDRRRKGR